MTLPHTGEHFKAFFLALNPACSSCPGERNRQEGNCAEKSKITIEEYPSQGCVTMLSLSPYGNSSLCSLRKTVLRQR